MTVHLPTPGSQRRLNEAARFATTAVHDETTVAPDHVEPEPAEQVRAAIAELDRLDTTMLTLDARMDRIEIRLEDPKLADEYGPTHSLRIEAEDRLSVLFDAWLVAYQRVRSLAWAVSWYSAKLIDIDDEETLDELGRLLSAGGGALPRIQANGPEYLDYRGWQRLIAFACPF